MRTHCECAVCEHARMCSNVCRVVLWSIALMLLLMVCTSCAPVIKDSPTLIVADSVYVWRAGARAETIFITVPAGTGVQIKRVR